MAKRVKDPLPKCVLRAATGSSDSPDTFERIAAALERLAPDAPGSPSFSSADAFSWHPDGRRLVPVAHVNRVEMSLLKGIDRMRDVLVENTRRFARGLPANNALLWGARGMGKSSLVKAVHASVNATLGRRAGRGKGDGLLKLVEIHREDIESSTRFDGSDARCSLSLHRFLRRSFLRGRGHQLQVAQGHARRRHRRPAG